MNGFMSLIEVTGRVSEAGLELAVQAGVYAALLAAAVLAINLLCRRWLSAGQMGVLWCLVLLRLMIPAAPASPLSLQNLFLSDASSSAAAVHAVALPDSAAVAAPDATPPGAASPGPVATQQLTRSHHMATALERLDLLPLAWVIGAAATVMGTVAMHWRFCRQVNQTSRCVDDAMLKLWNASCEQAGVRRKTSIVFFDGVQQPAVMGLVHPKLLLPTDAAELKPEQLRMIMLHELAHVRRQDVAVNWAMVAIRAVQWWNPVYWLAAARFHSLREQACDAFVIDRLDGRPARDYGELLLALAQGRPVAARWRLFLPASILGFLSSAFRNRSIRTRLRALRTGGAKRGRFSAMVALGVIFVVAISGLTDAAARPAPAAPQSVSAWMAAQPARGQRNKSYAETPRYEGPLVARTYDVEKVLYRMAADAPTAGGAQNTLERLLATVFPLETAQATYAIDGATLTAHAPAALHEELAGVLEAWAESGLGQFVVQCRFITSSRDVASDVGVSWEYMEAFSSDQAEGAAPHRDDGMPVLRVATAVDEYRPMVVATLTDGQATALINASQGDRRTNVLQAPKVTLFNGQQAAIVDCAQRPFVVGVTNDRGAAQPKIVVLEEGSRITVRGTQRTDLETIRLEASIHFSAVDEVATTTAVFHGRPVTIQTPRVKRAGFDVDFNVEQGRSLLIGCLPAFEQQDFFYALLSVRELEAATDKHSFD